MIDGIERWSKGAIEYPASLILTVEIQGISTKMSKAVSRGNPRVLTFLGGAARRDLALESGIFSLALFDRVD